MPNISRGISSMLTSERSRNTVISSLGPKGSAYALSASEQNFLPLLLYAHEYLAWPCTGAVNSVKVRAYKQ